MSFTPEFYDADTLALMTRALKEAMQEAAGEVPADGEFHIGMANRIMEAVAAGERDPEALKQAALSGVEPAPKSVA